jgi:hypothetical protein
VTEVPKTGVGVNAGPPGTTGVVGTVVPEPPATTPLAAERLPDVGSLESPQFEKSAFGCGPKLAPGALARAPDAGSLPLPGKSTVPEATPKKAPEEPPNGLPATDTRFVVDPFEHAVRATELTIASASARPGLLRIDRKSEGLEPRNLGERDRMVFLTGASHVPQRTSSLRVSGPSESPEKQRDSDAVKSVR